MTPLPQAMICPHGKVQGLCRRCNIAWPFIALGYVIGFVLMTALLVGCAMHQHYYLTDSPADTPVWITESRSEWRWFGAPVGQQPTDIAFTSQQACEAFRQAHPTYTKPEEVCRPGFAKFYRLPGFGYSPGKPLDPSKIK